MKRMVLILLLLALFAQVSLGAGEYLFYPVVSDNWSDGDNWYVDGVPGVTPGPANLAVISEYTGWAADAVLDAPGTCGDMYLGFTANGSLDVQSTLDVTTALYVGVSGGTGTIELNSASGTINSPYLMLGHTSGAVMNMSDGLVNNSIWYGSGVYAGSDGLLNMTGGDIIADAFYIGHEAGALGAVDLLGGTVATQHLGIGQNGGTGVLTLGGDGKMIIGTGYGSAADWLDIVNGMIGADLILNAQATLVGDTVEITAIPEPATLALLSLGLGFIRRKRS